jgi:hypothetical protein
LFDGGIAHVTQDVGDPDSDLLHFWLAHSSGGDRGAAQADSARFHRGQWIEGDGIFVDRDAGAVEGFFRVGAGDAARVDFDQEQVIVGAAGNDPESLLGD